MMFYRFSVFALLFAAMTAVVSLETVAAEEKKGEYKGPIAIISTKDGSTLYVANFDAAEVALINAADNTLAKTFKVGIEPTGLALNPDETQLFVTCGNSRGLVQVLNPKTGEKIKEIKAGHSPCAPVVTPDGKRLYVCNRFNATIVEYSLSGFEEVKKFKTIREPVAAAVTPDGKTLYVANHLPNDPSDSFDVAAEIACIDIESGKLEHIRLPNGSGSLQDMVISPDGKYLFVTEILARYQMPTTMVERGWMNTNGISIIDAAERKFINTVLIDDVDRGASNPWGIDITPDGKTLYVALSGTHQICAIDVEGMMEKLASLPKNAEEARAAAGTRGSTFSSTTMETVPNDLAFLVGLKRRITLEGNGPRGIVYSGNKVWTGMFFDDTVLKVDPNSQGKARAEKIELGPTPVMTAERRGQRNWNDANFCFQTWQSCASCHPDARMDAYNWDLMNDGMGNPKNVKSMLNCHKTPPAMWHGVRPTSAYAVMTGYRHILFLERTQDELDDTAAYMVSLTPLESPYLVNGKLSEAAERGKLVFNDPKVGCAVCHGGECYTDMKMHDVGTKASFDRKGEFDTPGLIEVWRTGPYLHDGRYVEMRDVFLKGKHGDVQGDVEGLSEQQIDDLSEYILSL